MGPNYGRTFAANGSKIYIKHQVKLPLSTAKIWIVRSAEVDSTRKSFQINWEATTTLLMVQKNRTQ